MNRTCAVEGCDRPYRATGLCNMHWQRRSKHGSTDLPTRPTISMEERFWPRVQPTGFCWEWTGALDSNGYGVFNRGARLDRSHRVAYELLVGPIPDGLVIDHLCRNRRCCNPDHLEPVTVAENFARAYSPSMLTARTDVCRRGHSMADSLVNINYETGGIRRMCRECAAMRGERRRRANSEANRGSGSGT